MIASITPLMFSLTMLLASAALAGDTATAFRVSEGPLLPIAVGGNAGGLVDGAPVVAGGSHWAGQGDNKVKSWRNETYVCKDNQWTRGPDLPIGLADAAYASGPGGLYLAGGTDGTKTLREAWRLSSTGSEARWEPIAPLPEPIESAMGAIVGDTFYVISGFADGKASNRVWSLDLSKPDAQWTARSPLPAGGRGYAAVVPMNGSIYLLGGYVAPPSVPEFTVYSDGYVYDPASDQWTQLDGFNIVGYAWSAAQVDESHILLAGRVVDPGLIPSEILLMNINDFSTRPVGNLVIQSCCMPAIAVNPTTWWFPGGEPDTKKNRTERTSIVELVESKTHE
jgi:hypothetical protein